MVRLFGREWGTKTEDVLSDVVVGAIASSLKPRNAVQRLEYRVDVEVDPSTGMAVYKPQNIKSFYDKYFDHDLVRGPIDDLAESALGYGYYTTVDTPPMQQEGRKASSTKAKELIDQFGKAHNLDSWNPTIGKNLLIAGFLPVETLLTKGPVEKCTLKLIHPTTVKEVWVDRFGEINKLVQNNRNNTPISGDKLAWFEYGRIGNDPFGTSWVRGVNNVLDILDSVTDNVDLILSRYLAPKIIWKVMKGHNTEAFKQAITGVDADEHTFLGDLTPDEMDKKLYDILQIDPRVPFWQFGEYLDRRIYSYGRANNLWYSKDATVASAEALDTIVKRHENSLQRAVKRGVERYWFAPLTALNLGTNVEPPRLNFGVEKTGVEDIHIETLLVKGLDVRYLTPEQYFDLLLQLGLKVKPDTSQTKPIRPPDTEPKPLQDDEETER